MLKAILYLSLTAAGIGAGFVNPLFGAIACIEAYLLNPAIFQMSDGGFRYQLWTTIAFLVSLAIHRPRGLARVGRERAVLWALWIFVGIGALSALWAEISSREALDAIFEVFKTVLMISFLPLIIRNERDMSRLMIAFVVGAWHAGFMFTFGVRWGYIATSFGRGDGSVVPDPQTAVLVLFVPLVCLLIMRGTKLERILAVLALPFVLNGIVETYERTGFVALAVEMLLLLLILPKKTVLRLAPVLIAGACLFIFRLTPPDYWQRMGTIQTPTEEASANSRFVINSASWNMFLDHPWGVGYRNYPVVSPRYLDREYLTQGRRSAHNSFFTVACETGLQGFVAWIGAFGGALWLLRRIRKGADRSNPSRIQTYAMGLEFGLYGWLAGGWFQSYHEVDPAYWFAAIAVVLTRLDQRQKAEAAESVEEPDAIAIGATG